MTLQQRLLTFRHKVLTYSRRTNDKFHIISHKTMKEMQNHHQMGERSCFGQVKASRVQVQVKIDERDPLEEFLGLKQPKNSLK